MEEKMKQAKSVDVRGLACPQPVISARKAMLENLPVNILVSKRDQADNVSRMAERAGWTCELVNGQDHFIVCLVPGMKVIEPVVEPDEMVCSLDSAAKPGIIRTVIIESECMGRGDDALGKLLMKAFVNTMKDCSRKPGKLVFFNSGVKLTTVDSPVIDALKELSGSGTEILVCGTCLDFFKIKDRLGVGIVSNMFDIAESMLESGVVYIG